MHETMPSDQDVLAQLGTTNAPLLGSGGEAQVYALAGGVVARIMRPGAGRIGEAKARAALLEEIAAHAGHLPFLTPRVESVHDIDGRIVAIERRLPGEPVSYVLGEPATRGRGTLLASYLDGSRRISEIAIKRDYFGPLIGDTTLRATSWGDFAAARLAASAAACPADLRDAVIAAIQDRLPEPASPALVHLDYFPANVLTAQGTVSAVLDFGSSTVLGDARMEPWSAVAYLDAEISPQANDADRSQAMDWLRDHSLITGYERARRWLAASWSFAADDASLMAWCRRILA